MFRELMSATLQSTSAIIDNFKALLRITYAKIESIFEFKQGYQRQHSSQYWTIEIIETTISYTAT